MINQERRHHPARLRPRVGAWVRAFLPGTVTQLGTFLILCVGAANGTPVLWYSLGVGLAVTIWMVAREYINRPPTLKYWQEDGGYALNVRHMQTGKLLLRAQSTSLAGSDLREVNLAGANLAAVDLHGANFQGVDLAGANFRAAKLWSANLEGAVLRGTNFVSADLERANLQGADLRRARLGNANLNRASLCNADLRGASFVAFGLDMNFGDHLLAATDFTGARWNSATRWPPRFDPKGAGAIYVHGGEADLPIPHEVEMVQVAGLPLPSESAQHLVTQTTGSGARIENRR